MNNIKFFGDDLINCYKKNPSKTISLLVEGYKAEQEKLQSLKIVDEFFEFEEVIADIMPQEEPFKSIARSTLNGDVVNTIKLVELSLSNRLNPLEIVMKGLLPGVQSAVALYDSRLFFAPELLMSGEAIKEATIVATKSMSGSVEKRGTIVIHAPAGDIHDIGKNILKIVLEANMYHVIDLGTDVSKEKVIEAVKKYQPIMITGSALMTTTMSAFKETSQALLNAGINIPFALGGAPITQKWVEGIELGIYGRGPKQALEIAEFAAQGYSWGEIREKVHN